MKKLFKVLVIILAAVVFIDLFILTVVLIIYGDVPLPYWLEISQRYIIGYFVFVGLFGIVAYFNNLIEGVKEFLD